jgi:hypothetical protein
MGSSESTHEEMSSMFLGASQIELGTLAAGVWCPLLAKQIGWW